MAVARGTWVRRLGFCAGPDDEDFYACDRHKPKLDQGDVSLFFPLKGEETRASDDEAECYFCRGEDGPDD
jgi:hypothetical protein